MRIAIIFLVLGVLQVNATDAYSQKTRLSLNFSNTELVEVLDKIELESEFFFLYNEKLLDPYRKVDITADNQLISNILDNLFAGTDVKYSIFERKIILAPEYLTEDNNSDIFQQQTVTGTITDASTGEPMPGVNIQVKGTTVGAISDSNGTYSMAVPDRNVTLTFSFIGYTLQEIPLEGRTTLNISLISDLVGLDEVVVVGYGTQKKVNVTGSIGVADAERIATRPITSAGQGLQGVIPNLNVKITDGDPNTKADFNIRGYTSITGGKPLILVDGVPMDLERINPNDISNISVLKDAASSAIYGARAAFGVVLVETNKGKAGKINVGFSTEQSLAKPMFRLQPVSNSYIHAVTQNAAYVQSQGTGIFDDDYLAGLKRYADNPIPENEWEVVNGILRYYGYNDYQDKLITEMAPQQKYNFNVSGGTEKATYYVSFGYLNKDGYLNSDKNENFKRYNIVAKSDFQVFDWLKLSESITINKRNDDKPHFYNWDVNLNSAARVPPMMPIQFPDLPYYITPGDHDVYEGFIGMYMGGKNPENVRIYNDLNWYPYLENGGRETVNEMDVWLTQGITLTPLEGLTIKGDFSYQNYQNNYEDVASKVELLYPTLSDPSAMIFNGFSTKDFISNRNDYNQYYVLNVYADYLFDKLPNHTIKALVGFNQEKGRNSYIFSKADNLLYPTIWDLNATSGTQYADGGKSAYSLRGVFGRLNYNYKEKYLIEFNGRYDGTSRFPKDSRFGFFPSVSMGWRVSEESFMAGTSQWLDNLKIRASYGELGNQALGGNDQPVIQNNWGGYRVYSRGGDFYPYISNMESGRGNFIFSNGQEPYVSPGGLVSPSLTWESVTSANLGVDFTILKGKLDASADIYRRDTKNMLMRIDYPDFLGTNAPNANSADLRTQGWELSLTWRDYVGNWDYGVNLALADNQTEMTRYENPNGSLGSRYVGQKIGEIWGYVTEGIFQTDEEVAAHADQSALGSNWRAGDIAYKDLNNDGFINRGANTLDNPGDLVIIGNNSPRYTYGINTDISYKNFSLNCFFQGVLKRDWMPPTNPGNVAFWPFNGEAIFDYFVTDTWTPDRPDAYFFINQSGGSNWRKNANAQTRYLQNAAYMRLKNLRLSYDLPQNIISKVRFLNTAQIYFSGMNLFEITKMHKVLDPETTTNGVQLYYFQRIYTLGIKITI